jgi:hypothetical protein
VLRTSVYLSPVAAGFRDGLLDVWETFTAALPAARLERHDGYVVLSYPPFPSAAMNAVWSWGGGGGSAAAELASRLAEIEAAGVSPGVGFRATVRSHARALRLASG